MSELVVVRPEPLCAETPFELQDGFLTPTPRFYIRNHFPAPDPPTTLTVDGAVARPLGLRAADLRQLPRRTLAATLECAGNGRAFIEPPAPGEAWRLGAVSTAEWEGVSLSAVLGQAGVDGDVEEIVFRGADGFARSLPLHEALRDEVLLVDTMNGEPLTTQHGAPLRLLVAGWYGMASVKWLVQIEAVRRPFLGHFQVERYTIGDQPVRAMEPRAVILTPAEGATISPGEQMVRGLAWTGGAQITLVELSDDGGRAWGPARLTGRQRQHAWRQWEFRWEPRVTGPTSLLARATDSSGRRQPLEPVWNSLGYCNNVAVPRRLTVDGPAEPPGARG